MKLSLKIVLRYLALRFACSERPECNFYNLVRIIMMVLARLIWKVSTFLKKTFI